jgi:sugar lactone lactonase YvrE
MKNKFLIALLSAVLVAFATLGIAHAISPWVNGQAANLVLGQPNFTTNTGGTSASKMYFPYSVAVDPTTGKMFVADFVNNRVLRFAGGASLANGAAAEAVLGQPNFATTSAGTTQSKMQTPSGVFVDASGRLWVADYGNHRVLRFDNAASIASGANANSVLGQTDFVSSNPGFGTVWMSYPRAVFVDASGRLWVTDSGNSRVLRFDNAAVKANGASADGVLGEPDFITTGGGLAQNRLYNPAGLVVTSAGALFVADFSNYRVLRFDNAASKANGANADAVLGQPDFTSNTGATIQNGMRQPSGVAFDNQGHLYVADSNNHRILIFNNAATLANGANADNVLGQTDFTTQASGVSATKLAFPAQLFVDDAAGALWVGDLWNNRVLRFAPPSSNANLSNLVLSNGALNPVFASGTITYTTSVANETTSITVTPTASDAGATITINGIAVASGNASSAITLAVGDNIVTIIVTAPDGATTKTYTVTVTRAQPPSFIYLPFVAK